jgi:hypothetical protein
MIADTSIKVLNNNVASDATSAVGKFFELCDNADLGYFVLPADKSQQVVAVSEAMVRLISSQVNLLRALEQVRDKTVLSPGFQKTVADIQISVSQTESIISEVYLGPDYYVGLLRDKLETIAQQNSYIDNHVESFRIAFDENCSALLADMATRMTATT